MSVVLVHQGGGLTQEKYEETVRKLTGMDAPPEIYPAAAFVAA